MLITDGKCLKDRVQLDCEYPGQTMMVALGIMLNFASIEEASGKGNTFSRASECGAVPGAGDAVSSTLTLLKDGVDEKCSGEEMVRRFIDHWSEYAGHQPPYADRVAPGLTKARPYIPEFLSRWDSWSGQVTGG
jgi:hypothetical protein